MPVNFSLLFFQGIWMSCYSGVSSVPSRWRWPSPTCLFSPPSSSESSFRPAGKVTCIGLIPGLCPANEGRHYFVTTSHWLGTSLARISPDVSCFHIQEHRSRDFHLSGLETILCLQWEFPFWKDGIFMLKLKQASRYAVKTWNNEKHLRTRTIVGYLFEKALNV